MKDIMINRIAICFVPAVIAVAITVFTVVDAFSQIGAGTYSVREIVYLALGLFCVFVGLGIIVYGVFRPKPVINDTFFINPITGATVHGHSEGQVRFLTKDYIYKSYHMSN